MPAFVRTPSPPLGTGPVGLGFLGRSRLFRYQVVCPEATAPPDEEWAVDSPQVLAGDEETARQILRTAPRTPQHTWRRRAPGTSEMWTSDSVVSWLLVKSGVDVAAIRVPTDGRAPGWLAGIELAQSRAQPP